MASVARSAPEPRYGSAAEVAAFAGLSVKTVRRLVGSGAVRGFKVGRRLLIPFDDVEGYIRGEADRRAATMATIHQDQEATPRAAVDARGRAIPRTEAEIRARAADVVRGLEALDAIGDETDTPELWAEVYRGIDEGRPHRPLFEGLY